MRIRARAAGVLLAAAVSLAVWTRAAGAAGRAFALVEKGRPVSTIVVPSEPNQAAWFAAGELQRHVETITGAVLPLANDSADVAGARILVGHSRATRDLGLAEEDLSPQEYRICFRRDALVLAGRDEPRGSFPVLSWGEWKRVGGKFGGAIEFDGKGSALGVAAPGFRDEAGTFEAWVFVPADGRGGGNFFRIESNPPWTYHLAAREGRRLKYQFWCGEFGGSVGSAELQEGWHHIMATWDAAAEKLEGFVDGRPCGTHRYGKTACGAVDRLGIGARMDWTPDLFFAGVVDEVRISNVVRRNDPDALSQPPSADRDTILLLHFDEKEGLPRDESGWIRKTLPPDRFAPQGTCYAVYDFLERFCGVRWYAPGELGTVCPRRETLTVAGGDIRRRPAIRMRIGFGWDSWGMAPRPSKEEERVFLCRMRQGGENYQTGHSFNGYFDRFWAPNPKRPEVFERERHEYFAKGEGAARKGWHPVEGCEGRPRQMCFSDPGLVEQVVRDARDYFDGRGAKYGACVGPDWFAVVPLDVESTVCECAACRSRIDMTRGRFFTSGRGSDLVWGFVNEVAREVRKTHPDKYIAALAYFDYAWYPKGFDVEPNVLVGPCIHSANWWSPEIRRNDLTFYKKWAEKARGRLHCVWLYQNFPKEAAQGFRHFPGFHAHTISEQMKMFAEDEVRGIFLCGTAQYVDGYVTYRAMDDPSLDVERVLDEFFTGYYGAAGAAMKRLYLAIESAYMGTENYPDSVRSGETSPHQSEEMAWGCLGTRERMAEFARCLDEARSLARTPVEKERVAIFERDVWRHMLEGRRQWEAKHPGTQ